MALPSSPPLVPSFDYPSSPPTLYNNAGELPAEASELYLPRPRRKRTLSDYGDQSSDPLYSEGTTEAEEESLEDEGRRRRKRLVRGPYFNHRKSSTSNLRRSMARREQLKNADSGVWMDSDPMSEDSIDSTFGSSQQFAKLEIVRGGQSHPSSSETQRRPSTAQRLATRLVNNCVEHGKEVVDISDLDLQNLDSAILKPLHQLIRHSHDDLTRPPSEDEFTTLTPSLQVFAFGNRISSLPSELFRLSNITVLSLRNNDLDHIPPSIARLPRLQELNIAQNRVQFLPWEMLNLMHCRGTHRQITVRPNLLVDPCEDLSTPSPLPQPTASPSEYREHLSRWGETSGAFYEKMRQWYSKEDVPWTMRHEMELRLKLGRLKRMNWLEGSSRAGVELHLCNEQLIYLASSAVRYFKVDGSLCQDLDSRSRTKRQNPYEAAANIITAHELPETTLVPSLFELMLRSIGRICDVNELNNLPNNLPPTITSALQCTARSMDYGSDCCGVCGKAFIIARAEWMEYWFNGFPSQECLTSETVLPFLRRVCSWRCAVPSALGTFLM